ncbi:MAG: plasmid pRiA4b ORF-3 family protein [Bifidobacteriaceae bacterium]|jgi:hypothetical protein|nr:plasmid pRiA4b ORF-3 family protein [Bifidobacteriaceae bacterium]
MGPERRLLIRATLEEIKPPTWRVFRLHPDLSLGQLHQVLQAAFGWTNRHLHIFEATAEGDGRRWANGVELVAEIGEGAPLGEVEDEEWHTVGATLTDQGGLVYTYDFGDHWRIRLEQVGAVDAPAGSPPAELVAASGHAPFEDVGGVSGWDRFRAVLADRDHEDRQAVLMWAATAGEPIRAFDPDFVDAEAVNMGLALIEAPRAGGVAPASEDAAAAAVASRLRLLLDRVPDGGLALTATGRLPPQVVAQIAEALGQRALNPGLRPRLEQTSPRITALRVGARRLGLVRVTHGKLYRTQTADRLLSDPAKLFDHCVRRAISRRSLWPSQAAGLLAACAVGAGWALPQRELSAQIAAGLDELGWQRANGDPLNWEDGMGQADDLITVFLALGAWVSSGYPPVLTPTPAGVTLARRIVRANLPEPEPGWLGQSRTHGD